MLQKADVAQVLAAEDRRARSRRVRRIVLIVLALMAALAIGFWVWSAWRSASIVTYVTEAATRGDLTVTLTATGKLEPVRSVPVSSLVTGTVVSVAVDFNDPVKSGQVLAQLDPADLAAAQRRAAAAVDAAFATRDMASASVDDARAALRRAEELDKNRNISSRDLELSASAFARAKANLAATEAQLRAAQADLATTEGNLARASIVAPIDGIVLDVNAEVGQTVSAASLASPMFTIASDLAVLDLEVDIDEADVPHVAVGDRVSFTVEAAPDRALDGAIRQVHSGPKITDGVTTYVAVIAVDNADLMLKPGMTATANIITDEARDVLIVANSALRFVPPGDAPPADQPHVYVLQDGLPQMVAVTTGISDGQHTEITGGGIAAGDLVITTTGGR